MNMDRRRFLRISGTLAALSGALLESGCGSQPVPAQESGSRGADQTPHGPRKLALLVGISKYFAQGGGRGKTNDADKWWTDLNCHTDVETLKELLMDKRFGFKEKDILVLTEAQATRQGITDAFRRHLIAQARPGDVALFHFSGHGQPIADDNGDELDGMDESLVPWDYISISAQDGYKTNLRDDTVGELLAELRTKMLGRDGRFEGNITVFLDSCFSGTATRGQLAVRGRSWDEAIDGPRPKPRPGGQAAKQRGASGLLHRGDAQLQDYVVLSACRNDQFAFETADEEGRPMGRFTCYLSRALRSANENTTYRDIFDRVSVDVSADGRDQNPQLEGQIDQRLFSNTVRTVPPYVVVQKVEGAAVTLPVGRIHGVTAGSHYALYKEGSDVDKPKNYIAAAEVDSVDVASSVALLTKQYEGRVSEKDLHAARAVERHHNFGADRLKVLLQQEGDWAAALRKLDAVTTKDVTRENYDVLIRPSDGHLVLEHKNGLIQARLPLDKRTGQLVHDRLLSEWRWRFLSRLHNDRPTAEKLKVQLRVVPLQVQTSAEGEVLRVLGERKDVRPTDGNRLVLHEGDRVTIELRNHSWRDLWVTVLELDPTGAINPIFPLPNRGLENQVPHGGQPFPPDLTDFIRFKLVKPLGDHVYKVIATTEPVDFRPLFQSSEQIQKRGGPVVFLDALPRGFYPLGQLLVYTATGRRSSQPEGVPTASWYATEVPFTVVPK